MLQNGTSHPRLHGNGGDKRNGGFEHIKVPIYPPGSLLHIVGWEAGLKTWFFCPWILLELESDAGLGLEFIIDQTLGYWPAKTCF